MHCGCRDAVLSRNKATFINVPFIGCTAKKTYASHSVLIVRNNLDLTDSAQATHSLTYDAF